MESLNSNWITEGAIDYEYKKYLLLAYLQHCRERFGEQRLYPPLADLISHYRSLQSFRSEMELMRQRFPKELSGLDLRALELQYQQVKADDHFLSTVTDIIEFAIPSIRETITEGSAIYELVESRMEFSPVGVEPIYREEGYLLFGDDSSSDIPVFAYRHSIIPDSQETLRSLEIRYVLTEHRSIAHTLEHIKLSLTRSFPENPNPATWFCYCHMHVPLQETMLPVGKRLLMKRLGQAA